MININLVLKLGIMKKNGFYTEFDSVNFKFKSISELHACDNVNDWLNTNIDKAYNYAELVLCSNTLKHSGFLIGTFKKIKLKNRGYKWIVSL